MRRVALLELVAEGLQGAGQDPGYLHLRHADSLGDLALGHRFEESHMQHFTFALRKRIHQGTYRFAVGDVFDLWVDVAYRVGNPPRVARAVGAQRGVQRLEPVRIAGDKAFDDLLVGDSEGRGKLAGGGARPSF